MSITEDDVLASITAKSDQLNACDLVGGPITVTVTSVTKGAADQPIAIGIGKDRQPYKPCKSMRRVLVACWGANPNAWINRSMTLFCDQSVKWGSGEEVGGIRISHISDISAEKKVLLTVTKGKKAAYIVKPLLVSSDVSERVAKAIAAINSAKDLADLERIWKQAEKLYAVASEEQQMQMDVARDERKSLA
jgi:hypothetical protein